MRAGVEQALLGERAWGDEAHHVAPDHGLRPALPRLGRVLGLLAHRDAVALRDQALKIFVGGMHRHAAHGDVLAEVLAALGERDAERARGDVSVLEEQLVEIAHAVEQEAVGIGRFDLQILGHHRGGDARGARGPRLVRARDVSRRKIPRVRRGPRSLPRPWLRVVKLLGDGTSEAVIPANRPQRQGAVPVAWRASLL